MGGRRKLKVFLFAGQSNMAGCDAVVDPGTGVKDLAELGRQEDADRATLFTYGHGFNRVAPFYYPWGDIRGHVASFMGKTADAAGNLYKCIGPEVGFARALYAAGVEGVAIIKVYANYARLEGNRSPWVKPNSYWHDWTVFVDGRLEELKRLKGRGWTVEGFVWHQGIDDGILRRSRRDYEADLRDIIAGLRTKYADERTPFLLARSINSAIAGADNMEPIRDGQRSAAESDLRNSWVDTDDLGPYVNTHHLTAAAQLTIGDRFAREYLRLAD